MTKKEVETVFLNYSIEPYETDKESGDNKWMKEYPMIKHALTKANCFKWVHFGEYVDINQEEGTPIYCTSNYKNQKSQKNHDPMQPSSSFSRFLFGNYYRRIVGQQGLWQWLYPARKHATDDEYHSPIASNEPHAVIADGEAIQRVPGSLRELVRYCRNTDVPLYIINDP